MNRLLDEWLVDREFDAALGKIHRYEQITVAELDPAKHVGRVIIYVQGDGGVVRVRLADLDLDPYEVGDDSSDVEITGISPLIPITDYVHDTTPTHCAIYGPSKQIWMCTP